MLYAIIEALLLSVVLYFINGCSTAETPYKEYLLCVNGECELYVDVEELEVCINEWDSNLYNFETRCYNILDLDAERS